MYLDNKLFKVLMTQFPYLLMSPILALRVLLLLVSSGCLTGSWSVWSHAVTPHSTIYHLVFVI